MSWFNNLIRNTEKRSTNSELDSAINNVLTANAIADANSTHFISEEGSLNLSAVWACVRILADTLGTLPVHLYKHEDKNRAKLKNHPCHKLLQTPNSYTNRFDLMHHIMVSVALWGNGYARIHRDKYYRPNRLQLLHPRDIEPVLDTITDKLSYRLNTGEMLSNTDIIHIKNLTTNGYKGKSPISVHRDNLSLTLSAQKYGEKFFDQGGNMSGVFKYPSTLKPESYVRLKKSLLEQSIGLNNAHVPLLLEGGMEYERISIPPEDAQFIATRKFQKTEIATIFGIPPHMIADLERATNNNIEHQGMEFVTFCLMPYIVRIEEEFNRKLLRYDEADFYFLFNVNALLRGDAKTRSEYYKNMNFIGSMSANEIRALEDMNPYDGGNEYFVQQNMQTVSNAIKPINNDKK